MKTLKKLLFYTDSEIFGGHEKLLVSAIEHISLKPDIKIFVVFNKKNKTLLNSLNNNIKSIPVKLHADLFRTLINISSSELHDIFREIAPDLSITAQGSLHQSFLGICTAKMLKIPCASYIPFSETTKERHGQSSLLRKCKERLVISLVEHWITISQKSKNNLIQLGATGDYFIVKNGIEKESLKKCDKQVAKTKLNLLEKKRIITVIGRIIDCHKGHIFLINAILKWWPSESLNNIHIVFVGDGPDRHQLMDILNKSALRKQYSWFQWTQETKLFYYSSDLVVIPSRFEGVPLVMLEAMYCKIPVVASNCGAISEFLPSKCMFESNNSKNCVDTIINNLSSYDPALIKSNYELVSKEYNLQNFKINFELVVRKIVGGV